MRIHWDLAIDFIRSAGFAVMAARDGKDARLAAGRCDKQVPSKVKIIGSMINK